MVDRRQLLLGAGAATLVATTIPAPASAAPAAAKRKPSLVVGHRGASGYRPEHTLASYELAARMGADYIEPDLVITRDGVLVARHEPEIGGTTDVASRPEFAGRRRTVDLDGVQVTGWWTQDFTLAELKTLRAVERIPDVRQQNTLYNGFFEVPTFQEVLDLRAKLSRQLDREIGVYPETKHPTFFRRLGLDLETPLVRALRENRLDKAGAKVFVQSFEAKEPISLRRDYRLRVPLVFLTGASGTPYADPRPYADYLTSAGLQELSRWIDGIGPEKSQVIPRAADGTLGTPTALVTNAHAAGLKVMPYTFRAENSFLPADFRVGTDPTAFGRALNEQITFLRTGIDGLFTDQPDVGALARELAFAA